MNLDHAGSCPANTTCTFSPASVAITDTTAKVSNLTITANSSIVIQNYTITARGTDSVDASKTGSASATLEVKVNPFAVCGDNQWRDIPWETSPNPYGLAYTPGNSFSAARKWDGVYLFSEFNANGAFGDMHGIQSASCLYGYGSPICWWMGVVGFEGSTNSGINSSQVYSENPDTYTLNKFFKDSYTGNTWGKVGSYYESIGPVSKPWNTPHSVTDKDGRLWEFQLVSYGQYGSQRKAQYKCGALPNQAICNGQWQTMPGGGNTPSQPVGKQRADGGPYPDKIAFVIRGTNNQAYYSNCQFHGNECNFSNNWINVGGSPYYSPSVFIGAAWDIYIKDINKIYSAKLIPPDSSAWIVNYGGLTEQPWGTPYRFNDQAGRTWQLRRNADTTISYACGTGTNVCILPAFDASKSSVSPATVNINDNVTIRCDVGVRGGDFITSTFTGGQYISFDGYDVTTAKFTFKATQAGTHTVYCNTFATGQNFCASSNTAGTLTVNSPSQPNLNISASSITGALTAGTALTFNGTIRNQGTAASLSSQTRLRIDIGNDGSWNINPANQSTGALAANGTENEVWSNTWTATVGTHKYEICADITALNAESNEADNCVTQTFTIGNSSQPSISLSPLSFTFSGISGGATPAVQSLTISNTGPAGTTLSWTWIRNLSAGAGSWCKLQTSAGVDIPLGTGGSLSSGSSVIAKVAVSAPSNVGTFTDCGIRINDSNASNSPQNASVTYVVSASSLVNGSCGSANGVAVSSAPATNLCNPGTASAVTGSGPWNWTCNGSGGGANASCSADKLTVPSPDGTPTGCNSNNPANCPATGSVVCETVKLTWTDQSSNETGFYVYRNSTGNPPVPADRIATLPANTISYTTTPPNNNPYYYFVSAYIAGNESVIVAMSNNAISAVSCSGNLTTSDKDIISVNGVSNSTNDCQTNGEFPASTQFKSGDTIGFSVNLCNTAPASGGKSASFIVIDDTLYNLSRYDGSKLLTDPAAWNASVTGGLSISSITTTGTEPDNLKLRITLTGTVPPGPGASKLIFYAKVAFPTNFSGTSSRFQNTAGISYNNGSGTPANPVTKSTPLLLFIKGDFPTRIEVSP